MCIHIELNQQFDNKKTTTTNETQFNTSLIYLYYMNIVIVMMTMAVSMTTTMSDKDRHTLEFLYRAFRYDLNLRRVLGFG